jgi:hypothetical protein
MPTRESLSAMTTAAATAIKATTAIEAIVTLLTAALRIILVDHPKPRIHKNVYPKAEQSCYVSEIVV